MLARIVRIVVYTLLATIAFVVISLYLLFRHTPDWYNPQPLAAEQLQAATADCDHQLSRFYDQAGRNDPEQPIVVEVSQRQANSYLQALPLYSSKARLPKGLTDPMIVFQKDRLILACRYEKTGDRPISIHLKLQVEPKAMTVAIDSIQAGSLPLPEQFVHDQLSELRHRIDQAAANFQPDRKDPMSRTAGELVKLGMSFFRALDGEPVEREFVTPNSKRRVRLERVQVQEGRMAMTFVPLGAPAGGAAVEWSSDQMRRPRPGPTSGPGGRQPPPGE